MWSGVRVCGFSFTRRDPAVLVYERDGELCGSLALTDEGGGLGRLRWFVLSPALRGRGMGRSLVTDLLAFARGQRFTYGLEDIGRYYVTYRELMAHWDAVIPGKVLRIEHEDVVDDLDASVRRILEFCGLEFEPQCVEFYKTERSIRTASSEQVRRPIFKEGIDQWRNFEPWLGELKAVLGPLAGHAQ